MSWMAKLYETYEAGMALDLSDEAKLMPISHTLQNTHINIVIDGEGNFRRASVIEKTQIILPATEKSAGRSGKMPPPHPLADKLQYVAKDYPDFGGENSFYSEYHTLLATWCESEFAHPKAQSVLKYIDKGEVIADLVTENILHVDENNKLRKKWPFEVTTEKPQPLIFKLLPKKDDKKTKEKYTDQGSALVCWSVEKDGDPNSNTWTDQSLQQSWTNFDALTEVSKGLCFISGKEQTLASNHPAKLRHTGDKAKLVSANDISGFTFRGRFTDTKKSIAANGSQSVGISLEVTQKAHNALRWLISRQGYRNGDQVYVAWAVSGKAIPEPLTDSWAMLGNEITLQPEIAQEPEHQIDHAVDLGESFAHSFNNYLAGYRAKLEPNEQIVVMGLDSATPGRMGIIYYREILASEFLDRIHEWHSQFSWPQRHSREYPNPENNKKAIKKTIWPVSTPVPRVIAETAYGDVLKTNETLKKSLMERILPCIVDGRPFPRDVMLAAVRRTSNRSVKRLPHQYSNFKSENAAWEKHLGVACALFKGFYMRHPDKSKRREYAMALEEKKNSRDYLYGRLLAIAEYIEEIALNVGGESRPTTAARMMQRFADHPFPSWRNIELGLQPYIQRLQGTRPGFLSNRKKELDTVSSAFDSNEYTSNKPLSGEFLLGYHCQKQYWRNNKSDNIKNQSNKEDSHES
ncbi:MAG: type I-C CRISPR-associated protein Cas8c/Csd1 [Thermodesulfobacteriota bacterium]|nr:type I-C CRISPR-associated protein Cas8c/Csd1 [Thermodesulfobacteriota bacterium]